MMLMNVGGPPVCTVTYAARVTLIMFNLGLFCMFASLFLCMGV